MENFRECLLLHVPHPMHRYNLSMQKTLVLGLITVAMSIASAADAATESYSNVHTSVSGGSRASAVIETVTSGSGSSHSQVWINGELVNDSRSSTEANQQTSDRGLQNQSRTRGVTPPLSSEVQVQQEVSSVNGSTDGSVHIYRKENGQVVENRTVPITAKFGGEPIVARLYSTAQNNATATAMRPAMTHDLATTSGLPWLLRLPFFTTHGLGVLASTTMEDSLFIAYDEQHAPFQDLVDRIRNMFR